MSRAPVDSPLLGPDDLSFGLEEEVFVTAPTEPNLESLYYLARLLWRNPRRYYQHSDSNFARGSDMRHGLMSGVEVSTIRQATPEATVADLRACRQDMVRALGSSGALIVPIGHLLDRDTPTNVCGLHIHIGVPVAARESVYRRLAPYLPLLALLTASSPCRAGGYFGPAYRMVAGYATGPLRRDPKFRFQDLIISRRLGTVEARLFDPVWDLSRVETLLRALRAVVLHSPDRPIDYANYARLRELAATRGDGPDSDELYAELCRCQELAGESQVARRLFAEPPAAAIYQAYCERGLAGAYLAMHSGYCGSGFGADVAGAIAAAKKANPFRTASGVVGYYVIRLPYKISKVLRESGREQREEQR